MSACVHVYIQVECIAAILVGRMHSYVNLSSISASFPCMLAAVFQRLDFAALAVASFR